VLSVTLMTRGAVSACAGVPEMGPGAGEHQAEGQGAIHQSPLIRTLAAGSGESGGITEAQRANRQVLAGNDLEIAGPDTRWCNCWSRWHVWLASR